MDEPRKCLPLAGVQQHAQILDVDLPILLKGPQSPTFAAQWTTTSASVTARRTRAASCISPRYSVTPSFSNSPRSWSAARAH